MAAVSGDNQSILKVPKPALLLLIGEPHTEDQKELVIQRVVKELASWDEALSGVDIGAELQGLAVGVTPPEEGQYGDKVVSYDSEKASITVVLGPNSKTISSRLRSFLLLPGTYHHVIYSGLAIKGSACWLIQDGFYTASAFSDLLRCPEISTATKQGTISGTIAINVFAGGEWSENHLSRAVSEPLTMKVNPEPSSAASSGFTRFGDYLSGLVKVIKLTELLPASGVVGNIRFSRPTIYIFPGGQGDSALFGVSGFNLLVDGGYMRRSCFWDFTRHLDRIDALLVTHVGADNLFGLASVAERKARDAVHPEIGHLYMNAIEAPVRSSDISVVETSESSSKAASLQINLADEASLLVESLKKTGLVLNKCLAGTPSAAGLPAINLYHKVGHGSLDLYALTPSQDSKVLKEFFAQWSRQGNGFKSHGGSLPLSNQSSVCALLVWKPSSPTDMVTRILFPGTAPQSAILEALDKMKSMTIFQHAVYIEKDASSKSGGGVTKKQAARPTAQVPAPSPQKPSSLPMSAKTDKTDHRDSKKPQSAPAKAVKDTVKHAPAKSIVKDTKVDEVKRIQSPADAQSHADSPADGQKLEIPSPESQTSGEEKTEDVVKHTVSNESTVTVSSDNGVSTIKEDLETQVAEENGSVANYLIGDLQAVPEPNLPLEEFGMLAKESQDSDFDSHFVEESAVFGSSKGTQEFEDVAVGNSSNLDAATQSNSSHKNIEEPSIAESALEQEALPDIAGTLAEKVHSFTESLVAGESNSGVSQDNTTESQHSHGMTVLEPSTGETTLGDSIAAEAVFIKEKVDDDKDIDTAEESMQVVSHTTPVDNSHHAGNFAENLSELDFPKKLDLEAVSNVSEAVSHDSCELKQLPPDVVAHSLLRGDSLDAAETPAAASSENITEESKTEVSVSPNQSEHADLFNLNDLKSVSDYEPVNTNPFFGITETVVPSASDELFGAFKQTGVANRKTEEASIMNPLNSQQPDSFAATEHQHVAFDAGSTNPFSIEEHQNLSEGKLERDSLEREISQPSRLERDEFDPLKEWDQPLGLPAPNKLPGAKAEPSNDKKATDGKKIVSPTKPLAKQSQATGSKYQAKKDDKDEVEGAVGDSKPGAVSSTKKPLKTAAVLGDGASKVPARSQVAKKPAVGAIPAKTQLKPVTPFYVDLAYIPGHGMTEYVDLEFFRRVRARYYVLSTVSPDPATLGALVEAKLTWDDPDVPVTIIPTYDADVLRFWMAAHRDQLSQLRIDVAPAANRCTIQLQDHDAGCAAFRLEF